MANIKRANTSGITKTGVAISDVPDAPTIGAVADLSTGSTASVAYTAATTGGTATTFTATSSPGGLTGTGSSPITVSGLSTGTAYTFTVTASNTTGSSAASAASSSLTLASVGKFESIATSTVGAGGASSITFSSIPSTYTHLQIRGILRSDRGYAQAGNIMRFNSDTGNNYSWHGLVGDGSSASAFDTQGLPSFMYLGEMPAVSGLANTFGTVVIDILDYANTNKYKTVRTLSGNDRNGAGVTGLISGNWRNTNAITSITIKEDVSNLVQYSSLALYGIKGS